MTDDFYPDWFDTNGDGQVDSFEQGQAFAYAAYMAEQMRTDSSEETDGSECSYVQAMPIKENSSEEKKPASPADAGSCLVSLFGLILMFGGGIAGSIAILFHGIVVPACLNVFVCIFVGYHLLHMNDS